MASVLIFSPNHDIVSDIDYSITDGRVREFSFNGDVWFSEDGGIAKPGWKYVLAGIVFVQSLHIDKKGRGLRAFVIKMMEDGLIPDNREVPS